MRNKYAWAAALLVMVVAVGICNPSLSDPARQTITTS